MAPSDHVDRDERIDVLSRRVRWLERYRRLVALACALALSPLIYVRLETFLGADWPGVHTTALTGVGTVLAWWTIEVALAWITAIYETEHYRLLGERFLPRAQLLRK
jgi:hypothetical protein